MTLEVVRLTRRGVPGWLHTVTGRWFPLIAGADDDPPKDPPKDDPPKGPPADPPADPPKDDKPAPTQADLDKAYDKLRAAEQAAKDGKAAQKELDKLRAASLSETEKLQKDADDGKALAATATGKLRQVNLRDALSAKGYEGAQAKAVAKLLDGVEFDDDDEPKNLDDALKAAVTEYGDLAKPAKPVAPEIDATSGKKDGKPPALTAEQLQMAKSFGMTPEEYAANM